MRKEYKQMMDQLSPREELVEQVLAQAGAHAEPRQKRRRPMHKKKLILALAAALMWAVYSILVKRYTERYDNFLVTRRVFLWAFLTSLPLVLLTDGLPSLTPLFTQPNILISWLFLGVFGNAVCFAIWNIAFKRLGVVVTNNYLYASPFVTVVVGWLLLDEKISWMSILGAVLITLGVIFANKSTEQ